MEEEKTLGLKQEEETPAGDDHPANDTDTTPEDIDQEIDNTLIGEDSDPKAEDLEDGTVVLSKDALEKLKTERGNYKKALLSIKPKLKAFKKPDPVETPVPKRSEFLTKSEYQQGIEKQAIRNACQDSDVNDNWDKVMEYYSPRHGKDAVENILTDIKNAHRLFRLDNPLSDDEEKGTAAELAAEKNKLKGESRPLEGTKKTGKKILTRSNPVQSWYGDEEEK